MARASGKVAGGRRSEKPTVGSVGSRHWNAKFDERLVRKIRSEFCASHRESIRKLARKYGTTWETLSGIVKHRTWKHVSFTEEEVRELKRLHYDEKEPIRSLARYFSTDVVTIKQLMAR